MSKKTLNAVATCMQFLPIFFQPVYIRSHPSPATGKIPPRIFPVYVEVEGWERMYTG